MAKFKVGDKIIGNKKANMYAFTDEGWEGIVTKIEKDEFAAKEIDTGCNYTGLLYECFDLIEPHTEIILGEKENNMDILELYKQRKLNKYYKKYQDKVKEIESFDSIQALIEDTQDQLNALLGREANDRVCICIDNLHGQKLHDDITQEKIDFEYQVYTDSVKELEKRVEEANAMLSMTDDYKEQIKILKKYNVLNKDGKLNV